MNLKEILSRRYSTKVFDETKFLTNEQITKLCELTNLSASSYGLQPFKLVVVKDKDVKKTLTASSYGQKNIENSSHLFVFAIRTDLNEDFINKHIINVSEQRNVSQESLEGFRQMLIDFIKSKDNNALFKWASEQVYIALGTFLIACASEQIDACPIGGFIPEEYDEILNLKKYNLKSVVVAVAGYRSDKDKYQYVKKVRNPLKDMIVEL